jgi:hypothetical protein
VRDLRAYALSGRYQRYLLSKLQAKVFYGFIQYIKQREIIEERAELSHEKHLKKTVIQRIRSYIKRNNNLSILLSRFKKLKAFRTISNSYKALKDYSINIKNLKKDVLLRKRLTVAKHNDQSFFNDNGELVVLEDDSIEEHNFFKVIA